MHRRKFLAAVAALCVSTAIVSTPSYALQKLLANDGDSFMRGYETHELGGGFSDQISSGAWFYPVRSVHAIMRLLMDVWGAPYLPIRHSDSNHNQYVTGDIVVLEDAGDVPQPFNPDTYMATWAARITSAKANGARVVCLTMYDTSQSAWQAMGYTAAPVDSRFDVAAVGSPSGVSRSPNDCIRDAASANGAEVYDFAADAVTFAQWCYGQYLLKIVHADGVHNRMWLGIKMAYGILKHCGLAQVYVPSKALLEQIVVGNWNSTYNGGSVNLGYGSIYWSQSACQATLNQACT